MISLSKRDVREHLENAGRKAATSQCGGVDQPINAGGPMQPLYNLQSTFTGDARATPWIHSSFQYSASGNTGDTGRGQSDGLDVSSESISSDGSDTDERAQMVPPISRLRSFDDSEISGTEEVYQLTGLSLQDNNTNEGVDIRQLWASRSSQSRMREEPPENNPGYGGYRERPSSDSSTFGKSLPILICQTYH